MRHNRIVGNITGAVRIGIPILLFTASVHPVAAEDEMPECVKRYAEYSYGARYGDLSYFK